MAREDDFNPDLIQRQLIEKRRIEMLTEQRRPAMVNHQQYSNGPRFDPRLDTKMSFDANGRPLTINGKPVAEIEAQKNALLAAKLGLENTPEAIQKAKEYHQRVLNTYKVGIPAHLQMYGINEWAPVTEVAKYGNMIDLGDEAGQAVQQQAQQLREYSERKWGKPEDVDTAMRNLNPQQQQVAANMISGLAQGKVKFLHEIPGGNHAVRPPLLTEDGRYNAPQAMPEQIPQGIKIQEGAHVLSMLQTGAWPTPCPISKVVTTYNSAQHGVLIPTGRTAKTFIVQNEHVRVDPVAIQQNPHFVKDVIEVADARGGRYFILKEHIQQNNSLVPQTRLAAPTSNNKFLTDQKRLAPNPAVNQPSQTGFGANQNFQQFMQKKMLKG